MHPGRRLGLLALPVLVLVATAACSASSAALPGTTWTLVAVSGADPASPGSIEFTVDGRVAFQTPCNGGGGSYRVEGTRLSFGELMTTMMMCDAPAGDQEGTFLAVLNAGPSFAISGNRLTLAAGSDTLVFEAA